eukprot:TRINITY_DN54761_c0_g1_i1.p1 TRINITY_DN54761_c0_g1~~TRINITY_DN54761_c0_g1_i1.p1  ORF type:complete len:2451 (+),score=484.67 TRINITY_DN54761_c0_g1_i1:110-7462(+)
MFSSEEPSWLREAGLRGLGSTLRRGAPNASYPASLGASGLKVAASQDSVPSASSSSSPSERKLLEDSQQSDWTHSSTLDLEVFRRRRSSIEGKEALAKLFEDAGKRLELLQPLPAAPAASADVPRRRLQADGVARTLSPSSTSRSRSPELVAAGASPSASSFSHPGSDGARSASQRRIEQRLPEPRPVVTLSLEPLAICSPAPSSGLRMQPSSPVYLQEVRRRLQERRRSWGSLQKSWLVKNAFAEWKQLVRHSQEGQRAAGRASGLADLEKLGELQRSLAEKERKVAELEQSLGQFRRDASSSRETEAGVRGVSQLERRLLLRWSLLAFARAAEVGRLRHQVERLETRLAFADEQRSQSEELAIQLKRQAIYPSDLEELRQKLTASERYADVLQQRLADADEARGRWQAEARSLDARRQEAEEQLRWLQEEQRAEEEAAAKRSREEQALETESMARLQVVLRLHERGERAARAGRRLLEGHQRAAVSTAFLRWRWTISEMKLLAYHERPPAGAGLLLESLVAPLEEALSLNTRRLSEDLGDSMGCLTSVLLLRGADIMEQILLDRDVQALLLRAFALWLQAWSSARCEACRQLTRLVHHRGMQIAERFLLARDLRSHVSGAFRAWRRHCATLRMLRRAALVGVSAPHREQPVQEFFAWRRRCWRHSVLRRSQNVGIAQPRTKRPMHEFFAWRRICDLSRAQREGLLWSTQQQASNRFRKQVFFEALSGFLTRREHDFVIRLIYAWSKEAAVQRCRIAAEAEWSRWIGEVEDGKARAAARTYALVDVQCWRLLLGDLLGAWSRLTGRLRRQRDVARVVAWGRARQLVSAVVAAWQHVLTSNCLHEAAAEWRRRLDVACDILQTRRRRIPLQLRGFNAWRRRHEALQRGRRRASYHAGGFELALLHGIFLQWAWLARCAAQSEAAAHYARSLEEACRWRGLQLADGLQQLAARRWFAKQVLQGWYSAQEAERRRAYTAAASAVGKDRQLLVWILSRWYKLHAEHGAARSAVTLQAALHSELTRVKTHEAERTAAWAACYRCRFEAASVLRAWALWTFRGRRMRRRGELLASAFISHGRLSAAVLVFRSWSSLVGRTVAARRTHLYAHRAAGLSAACEGLLTACKARSSAVQVLHLWSLHTRDGARQRRRLQALLARGSEQEAAFLLWQLLEQWRSIACKQLRRAAMVLRMTSLFDGSTQTQVFALLHAWQRAAHLASALQRDEVLDRLQQARWRVAETLTAVLPARALVTDVLAAWRSSSVQSSSLRRAHARFALGLSGGIARWSLGTVFGAWRQGADAAVARRRLQFHFVYSLAAGREGLLVRWAYGAWCDSFRAGRHGAFVDRAVKRDAGRLAAAEHLAAAFGFQFALSELLAAWHVHCSLCKTGRGWRTKLTTAMGAQAVQTLLRCLLRHWHEVSRDGGAAACQTRLRSRLTRSLDACRSLLLYAHSRSLAIFTLALWHGTMRRGATAGRLRAALRSCFERDDLARAFRRWLQAHVGSVLDTSECKLAGALHHHASSARQNLVRRSDWVLLRLAMGRAFHLWLSARHAARAVVSSSRGRFEAERTLMTACFILDSSKARAYVGAVFGSWQQVTALCAPERRKHAAVLASAAGRSQRRLLFTAWAAVTFQEARLRSHGAASEEAVASASSRVWHIFEGLVDRKATARARTLRHRLLATWRRLAWQSRGLRRTKAVLVERLWRQRLLHQVVFTWYTTCTLQRLGELQRQHGRSTRHAQADMRYQLADAYGLLIAICRRRGLVEKATAAWCRWTAERRQLPRHDGLLEALRNGLRRRSAFEAWLLALRDAHHAGARRSVDEAWESRLRHLRSNCVHWSWQPCRGACRVATEEVLLLKCSFCGWQVALEQGRARRSHEAAWSQVWSQRRERCRRLEPSLQRRENTARRLFARTALRNWARLQRAMACARAQLLRSERCVTSHSTQQLIASWRLFAVAASSRRNREELAILLAEAGRQLAKASAGHLGCGRLDASLRSRVRQLAGALAEQRARQASGRAFSAWLRSHVAGGLRRRHSEVVATGLSGLIAETRLRVALRAAFAHWMGVILEQDVVERLRDVDRQRGLLRRRCHSLSLVRELSSSARSRLRASKVALAGWRLCTMRRRILYLEALAGRRGAREERIVRSMVAAWRMLATRGTGSRRAASWRQLLQRLVFNAWRWWSQECLVLRQFPSEPETRVVPSSRASCSQETFMDEAAWEASVGSHAEIHELRPAVQPSTPDVTPSRRPDAVQSDYDHRLRTTVALRQAVALLSQQRLQQEQRQPVQEGVEAPFQPPPLPVPSPGPGASAAAHVAASRMHCLSGRTLSTQASVQATTLGGAAENASCSPGAGSVVWPQDLRPHAAAFQGSLLVAPPPPAPSGAAVQMVARVASSASSPGRNLLPTELPTPTSSLFPPPPVWRGDAGVGGPGSAVTLSVPSSARSARLVSCTP